MRGRLMVELDRAETGRVGDQFGAVANANGASKALLRLLVDTYRHAGMIPQGVGSVHRPFGALDAPAKRIA